MSTTKCKICKRFISGGRSVWETHCLGKKHINLLPNHITVKAPFNDGSKINELNEYFKKFGTILKSEAEVQEDAIVINYYFQNKRVYTNIIHQVHQISDKMLEISWIKAPAPNNIQVSKLPQFSKYSKTNFGPVVNLSVNQNTTDRSTSSNGATQTANVASAGNLVVVKQAKNQKMATASPEEAKASIIESVKEGKTFIEQVSILLQKLQACDVTEVEKNRKIIYDDLSTALAPLFPLHQIHFFGSSRTGLDFKGSDLDVYVAKVKQRHNSEVSVLKTIRTLIYKSKKFCDLLLISGATVPIIKCIHTRTQICCDLNIRNRLSVANTELIKYYLTLDEKLRPLMIIIKFWAEIYGLKKANFFSGYALYLLVIFYLQQEPYNLPAVVDLQKNHPPDVEDGWNCAFKRVACAEAAFLRDKSLLELLGGFFRFYSNFDYIAEVICPFVGKSIKKVCFIKPYELPNCYKPYEMQSKCLTLNSGICIQDPFEHNRNVSSSIPLQHVGKFTLLCRIAHQFTSECEEESLHKLLTQCISDTKQGFRHHTFVIEKSHGAHDENAVKKWFESVQNTISKILEKIMCCNVSLIGPLLQPDQTVYECQSKYDIWNNRSSIYKNLQKQLPPETNEFEREIAVSSWILKYFPQVVLTKMRIYLYLRKDPCRVEIVTRLVNKSKMFYHIGHYLQVKLPLWLSFLECEIKNENENENISKSSEENPSENISDVVSSVKTETAEMIVKDEKISEENNVCSDSTPDKQVNSVFADDSCQSKEKTPVRDHVGNDFDSGETNGKPTNGDGEESAKNPEEEGELPNGEDEEEEEDVPADFFDDFSNQDFMDGLDIVDAWDDESGKLPEGENAEESDKNERKLHSPIRFASKESYRKSSERRSKHEKYVRSRSRSPVRRRKRSGSYKPRSRSRSRDKSRTSDLRRDPEKTKRDINKDKLKCAKDREQKLVSDKLKIVETGLVPPGTEMEVDISSIIKEKRRSPDSSVERMRDLKSERERKYSRRSSSRETRKTAKYSRSPPVYRSRNRTESSYRSRRRTSSVNSNVSERELWIRSGRKRSRSRSRSRESPVRPKLRKYEEKLKKKSFLEEIRDKLNEVRPLPVVQYSHPNMSQFTNPNPSIHPIPAPVPAPNQFFSPTPNNPAMQQYDQRFFIGDSYMVGPSNVLNQPSQNVSFNNLMNNAGGNIISVPQVPMSSLAQIPQIPVQLPTKLPVAQQNASASPKQNETAVKSAEQKDKQTTDDIDKLFADKKISLSDFLTITAKCEVQSASPEHLQKKIKVISRCQDAIKAMSDDRKFTGRLSVKPSSEAKNKPEVKYQSPLRRIPIVRFQFTSPAKVSEETDGFAAALDKILQKIGILKETVDLDETPEGGAKGVFADEDTLALTLKASLLKSDASTCEECKKRRVKVFADVGSQCADGKETTSIGIQVNEEDLTPTKGLLKNDSIAYLTPAQLLGKEKESPTTPPVVANENKTEKQKIEVPEAAATENKKEKPKIVFNTRGGFRKSLRDRQFNNSFDSDEFEYFDRGRSFEFEEARESFTPRFPLGTPSVRFPRHFLDNGQAGMVRINQLREDGGSLFTDFNQPYRARNPNRFGPRY